MRKVASAAEHDGTTRPGDATWLGDTYLQYRQKLCQAGAWGSSWATNKHKIPISHSYLYTHGLGEAEITRGIDRDWEVCQGVSEGKQELPDRHTRSAHYRFLCPEHTEHL